MIDCNNYMDCFTLRLIWNYFGAVWHVSYRSNKDDGDDDDVNRPLTMTVNTEKSVLSDTVKCSRLRQIIIIILSDAKRSADASRRCEIAIVRQNGLSSGSCRASVAVTPCHDRSGGSRWWVWPTTATSQFLRWPLAVSRTPWCIYEWSYWLVQWVRVWQRGRNTTTISITIGNTSLKLWQIA